MDEQTAQQEEVVETIEVPESMYALLIAAGVPLDECVVDNIGPPQLIRASLR